jgi:hypothetical protein
MVTEQEIQAAKLRVMDWLTHFERERKAQLAGWIQDEEDKKRARFAADGACFWSRVGQDYNPKKGERPC